MRTVSILSLIAVGLVPGLIPTGRADDKLPAPTRAQPGW